MPHRLPRQTPWVLAVGIALALTAGAASLVGALDSQRSSGEEISRRFETVLTLRRVLRLAVDAETGQRGYLLTGQPAMLEPYERAIRDLPAVVEALESSGAAPPDGTLRTQISRKLEELARTIALADSGQRAEALRIVQTGEGRRALDTLRAQLETLTNLERDRIAASLTQSQAYAARTYRLLAFLAVCVLALGALGLALLLRTQRLESEAARLREVEAAERQTRLIARELNHRVKNLFAVVLAIVQLAGRGASSAGEAVARIKDRVQALAHAHEVSLGQGVSQTFGLEALIRATLAPYARGTAELEISGPALELPVMRVTPLGMIVHELATNAVKHGAWAQEGGKVRVSWSVESAPDGDATTPRLLRLCWEEDCAAPLGPEGGSGFGSRLIGAAVAQLGGRLVRERRENGLVCTLDAPVVEAQAEPPSSER